MSLVPDHISRSDIQKVHEFLVHEPNSTDLDSFILKLGFTPEVTTQLRRDNYTDLTIDETATLFATIITIVNNQAADAFYEWFLEAVREDIIDLFSTIKLTQQPRLIRALEEKFSYTPTGNLSSLLE